MIACFGFKRKIRRGGEKRSPSAETQLLTRQPGRTDKLIRHWDNSLNHPKIRWFRYIWFSHSIKSLNWFPSLSFALDFGVVQHVFSLCSPVSKTCCCETIAVLQAPGRARLKDKWTNMSPADGLFSPPDLKLNEGCATFEQQESVGPRFCFCRRAFRWTPTSWWSEGKVNWWLLIQTKKRRGRDWARDGGIVVDNQKASKSFSIIDWLRQSIQFRSEGVQ